MRNGAGQNRARRIAGYSFNGSNQCVFYYFGLKLYPYFLEPKHYIGHRSSCVMHSCVRTCCMQFMLQRTMDCANACGIHAVYLILNGWPSRGRAVLDY